MLDQLAVEVQETIQELRELAHGIYPPLLVDTGLVEALRAAANRSPLAVASSPRGSAGTPPRSRRPCTSAASKHSRTPPSTPRTRRVEVRLWEESGGLLFAVSDDGPGFDVERRRSAVMASSTCPIASGRSAAPSAGTPSPGTGPPIRGSIPLV